MKKNFNKIIIIIVLFALFVQSYNLKNSFHFSGEFGDNFLDIKNAIFLKVMPLVGPPTSHPWINFGPLYFWIMIPLVKLFKFEPIIGAWLGVFAGTSVIVVNYLLLKKIIDNEKTALISSLLIAVSPLWISFTKDARFFFFVTLFFYPFLYYLKNLYEHNKDFFKFGFFYSLFFHFHYSPILLIPVIYYFIFLNRKSIKLVSYFHLLIGLLIPQVPLLIYDANNGFTMISKFILWIPYRIAGFVGLYPKNNLSSVTLKQSLAATNEFLGRSFLFEENLWIFMTTLFIILFLVSLLKYLEVKKYTFFYSFCYISFLISIIGIFIHGDIPVHYFLPIFSVPIFLVSDNIRKLFENKKNFFKGLLIGLFVFIFILNTRYFLKYYSIFNRESFSIRPNFVSLDLQKRIAKYIINDVSGQKFSLVRVGPGDNFEEYYSQNYKYLLWLYGNEPVENSDLSYTIYENLDELSSADRKKVKMIGPIGIIKNE